MSDKVGSTARVMSYKGACAQRTTQGAVSLHVTTLLQLMLLRYVIGDQYGT
jgi:hypothetical protein